MAKGFTPIKGGPSKPKGIPKAPEWVLGSRPAVLRSEPLGRPTIKPQGANIRNYGKQAAPFSTLGQGNTSDTDMT